MTTTRVWAITMMRDEGDVAEHVIRHMAEEGVDGIIVADNNSTDETREILTGLVGQLPCELVVVDDPDVGYYQSAKMTGLARQAADRGAEWIVPFDADELWYAHRDRVGVVLAELPGDVQVAHATLFNHFPSAIDPPGTCPFMTIVWRQPTQNPLPKVAFRWHPDASIQQGNHSVWLPGAPGVAPAALEVRHFPYRTFDQFRRKALNGKQAYDATDLPTSEGAHWRQYGAIHERLGDDGLREVFEKWFWFLAPVNAGLVEDPAPFRRWVS